MQSTVQDIQIELCDGFYRSHFQAMASPCEVLVETANQQLAESLGRKAYEEALRIERTFSRYRDDNIIHQINHSHGKTIQVDDEMANLLDYAAFCFELSEGMFDITSGVLGKAWSFNGQGMVPDAGLIQQLLPLVGWNKLCWTRPSLSLLDGMQIDLGGIGKEYAVDRVAGLLSQQTDCSILINFGGDLFCNRARRDGAAWQVGIEQPDYNNINKQVRANRLIEITTGGLATSGDARRHIVKNGKRYGHILNPKTGWPVEGAPCSVTVAAASCTEAGILATLAMLHGGDAEVFLEAQEVQHWIIR